MESIASILSKKSVMKVNSQRKVNMNWEEARMFAEYVGLSIPFVLRLFKNFGKKKVLNLKSWLKDCPYDPKKGMAGLVVWKLKQN